MGYANAMFVRIFVFCFSLWMALVSNPSLALAASQNAGERRWKGIQQTIEKFGGWLYTIAPALFAISFLSAALAYATAGSSQQRVEWAKGQMVATVVAMVIIGGFFIFRAFTKSFTSGWF